MAANPPRFTRATNDPAGASLEYGLQRSVLLAEVELGRKTRLDVCDAHPELLRAARSGVGTKTDERCPICDDDLLRHVTYVFGAKLPPGGTCPTTKTELNRLKRREEPVTCFEVEVCPSCAWHHLLRRYPAGGITPKKRAAT